jgi:hypothetical protein
MLERNLSTPNFSTIVAMYNEDLTLTLLAVLVLRSSVHRVAIVQTNQWGASGATVYTHVSSTAMYLVSVMFLVNVESVLVRGSKTDSSRMVAAVLSRNCAMIDERNTRLDEKPYPSISACCWSLSEGEWCAGTLCWHPRACVM